MIGFRKSHAVVIGIDEYGQGIPSLRTAVNDAGRIAQVLETGYGYAVRLLTEHVSLANLRAVFDESLPNEIEADDRLLVYFAGHGIALDGDDGPAGYLVPQDAGRQDKGSFLAMADLNCWLDKLPCRHLLLVLDCCFAGAYRWSSTRDLGALPEVIHRERFDRYIKDPAWQVITSAAYDQKALDVLAGEIVGSRGADHGTDGHSPFALAFLTALETGEADLIPRGGPDRQGGDGVITATELYLYLREYVEVRAKTDGHLQTPGLWPLKKHDKGEYIHLVPGHPLNLPPAPTLDEANNPWRGLQSYDEEHAQIFFGRSRFVAKLADRVRAHSLTVVLGASGTGKSSVVKAGLVSHLRTIEPAAWRILPPIRPGKSPLASLACLSLPGEAVDDLGGHLADFRIDPEALARRVGAWAEREPGGRMLLLVIDQFEELITLCWDAAERDHLMQLLQRALAAHPERLRVVLTLRSDFEPQFARSPFEGDWRASQMAVPALTIDEYRETIEKPASVKVLYFKGKTNSQAFINRLIGDVANTPGGLPLLSFTLSELYRRYLQRGGEDRALSEEDYEALGCLGGSLRNRAEEVYRGLPDEATRETMKRVMLRMISADAGKPARRHVPDTELVYRDPAENKRVADVLRRLTEARLVVKGKETGDEPYVEPAHDEIVRGWDRLDGWFRDEQEGLLLRRILSPAAEDWKRGQGGLFSANPRLWLLQRVLISPRCWLNRTESEFVQQSVLKRRAFWGSMIGAVAVAFVVLSGITWYAFSERDRAQQKERIATSRQFAALSTSERDKHLDTSLLLAVEALGYERTFEARDSLYQSLHARPGLRSFLHGGAGDVGCIALSLDGKTLAAGFHRNGDDGVVMWDIATRQRLTEELISVSEGAIGGVAFSPDGKTLAAGFHGNGNGVVLWELDGASWKRKAASPLAVKEGAVESVAFSPDGTKLAAGFRGRSPGGGVALWERDAAGWHRTDEGALTVSPGGVGRVVEIPNPKDVAKDVAPAFDGLEHLFPGLTKSDFLRSIGPKNSLRRPLPPMISGPVSETGGGVRCVAFSPDGTKLAAGFHVVLPLVPDVTSGGVVLWELATRRRLGVEGRLNVDEGAVESIAFSPDSQTLAAGFRGGGLDSGVVLWWASTGKRRFQNLLAVKEGDVVGVAYSPDGTKLAAGFQSRDGDGGLVLWEGGDMESWIRTAEGPRTVKEGVVVGVAYSPDGKTVAAGFRNGVLLWDAGGWSPLADGPLTGTEGHVVGVAFSPDAKALAAVCDVESGSVVRWNLGERQLPAGNLLPAQAPFGFKCVAFSPDGTKLAAGFHGDASAQRPGQSSIAQSKPPGSGSRKALVEATSAWTPRRCPPYSPSPVARGCGTWSIRRTRPNRHFPCPRGWSRASPSAPTARDSPPPLTIPAAPTACYCGTWPRADDCSTTPFP